MLSETLNTEIVAGVYICRTHVLLTILYVLYNTIPRYNDEPKGEKKKIKMCFCLGFFVVGFGGFLNEKVELSFKKYEKYNNNYKIADLLRQMHWSHSEK